jgi:GWxTD domain-containing protein
MKRTGFFTTLVLLLLPLGAVVGQQKTAPPSQSTNTKKADDELSRADRNWLEQDVVYLITDDERHAFERLRTPEEREQFKENFWLRRDQTPDTIENEFREEHYARIAYANERFASGKPGWKTDRGRIYILYGRPDDVEDYPTGGPHTRSFDEGGGTTQTYPFQKWTYRYLEGLHRNNVELEFVDPTLSGEYRLTIDPNEKDAMLHIPGASRTPDEEQDGGDPTRLGTDANTRQRYNQFDRLELLADIFKPPEVKFKDLEAIVTTKLSFNTLPFNMRLDFVRVTEESVLTPITFQIAYKDLAFQEQEGIYKCTAHVFGVITSVTGRRITTIESTVEQPFPAALYPSALTRNAVFQQTVPLRPGLYKIDIVIKDVNSGNVGIRNTRFTVPRIPDEKLSMSSLILADRIEQLPDRTVGAVQFALAGQKVVPNVTEEFEHDQALNLWLQVYSLKVDNATHKPSATVETLVTRNGTVVKKIIKDAFEFSGAAQQMTITQALPLAEFPGGGSYTVQLKVTDNLTGEVVTSDPRTFKFR